MVRTDDEVAGYGTYCCRTTVHVVRASLMCSGLQHGGTTKEASRHKQESNQATKQSSNQASKQVKRPTFSQLPASTPPNQCGWLLAVRFSSSTLPPFFLTTTVPYGMVFTFPLGRYTISYILLGEGGPPRFDPHLGSGSSGF